MEDALDPQGLHRAHASLSIRGRHLDPSSITEALRIHPQLSFRRGDIRKSDGRQWPHGLWLMLSTESVDSIDPIAHLRWILAQLNPVKRELARILEDVSLEAELGCFWIMPDTHGQLVLDPQLIDEIAGLKMQFELAVYSPNMEAN